jgi:hypothetical protein
MRIVPWFVDANKTDTTKRAIVMMDLPTVVVAQTRRKWNLAAILANSPLKMSCGMPSKELFKKSRRWK